MGKKMGSMLACCFKNKIAVARLYPGHGPEDIRRYPGHMTRDTAAVISWVICPGYLLISLGHVANHQICTLITANNRIT